MQGFSLVSNRISTSGGKVFYLGQNWLKILKITKNNNPLKAIDFP